MSMAQKLPEVYYRPQWESSSQRMPSLHELDAQAVAILFFSFPPTVPHPIFHLSRFGRRRGRLFEAIRHERAHAREGECPPGAPESPIALSFWLLIIARHRRRSVCCGPFGKVSSTAKSAPSTVPPSCWMSLGGRGRRARWRAGRPQMINTLARFYGVFRPSPTWICDRLSGHQCGTNALAPTELSENLGRPVALKKPH